MVSKTCVCAGARKLVYTDLYVIRVVLPVSCVCSQSGVQSQPAINLANIQSSLWVRPRSPQLPLILAVGGVEGV